MRKVPIKSRLLPLMLVTLVILLPLFISCGGQSEERAQIIDYIDKMLPVMDAHANLKAEQRLMAEQQASPSDLPTYIVKFRDLARRMGKIYMDVESSVPPPILREFKNKWSKECQLELQAHVLGVRALEEHNQDFALEASKLIFQANEISTEYGNELLDLMKKYDIE